MLLVNHCPGMHQKFSLIDFAIIPLSKDWDRDYTRSVPGDRIMERLEKDLVLPKGGFKTSPF